MNSFGKNIRVGIFGASHGQLVGLLLDGFPAGIAVSEEDFAADIARRAPHGAFTTARHEDDIPHIVSGVYEGHSTGAPICILFYNKDQHSSDYEAFRNTPRPGTADYTAAIKYGGFADMRGSGPFSGRLTLPLVAAGVLAKKLLPKGLSIKASICELGGESDSSRWKALLEQVSAEGDSLGAVLSCSIEGLPAGLGEPFWDSCESLLSHAIFSIPGVRGVEFGDGFAAAAMRGSRHNDPIGADGPEKNGAGGINGGISNGAPLFLRVAFKPTSSIAAKQQSYDFAAHAPREITVGGRHDVCFALRCPVIVEAACAVVIADLLK